MSVVGVVGDCHAPFIHPMYRRFVNDTFNDWGVEKIHFVGDLVDHHAISFHEHDPNGRSAEDEAVQARKELKKWVNDFPVATVCIGNHDERHYRTAKKAGLPDRYLRAYNEIWETPKWKWDFSHAIDDVLYEHGTGTSGKDAAINLAIQKRCSVVIGHIHSWAGIKYHANDFSTVFGMNAGCGIDCRSYAFAYGKAFATRPMLGCGIVIDGHYATFIPMLCSKGEKYNRSRAGRKR